jgi:hypothetical protein
MITNIEKSPMPHIMGPLIIPFIMAKSSSSNAVAECYCGTTEGYGRTTRFFTKYFNNLRQPDRGGEPSDGTASTDPLQKRTRQHAPRRLVLRAIYFAGLICKMLVVPLLSSNSNST